MRSGIGRFLLAASAAAPLMAFPSRAANFTASARGTTGGDFLTLGAGARAASMGEAYSAVADEASAIYWNPAAMTQIHNRSATFMHSAYIDSSYFDFAAYAQNLGERGVVGAGIQSFSAGPITQRDPSGINVGSFTPNSQAFSVGYAYRFDAALLPAFAGYSVGVVEKIVETKILASARTWTNDAGILSPDYLNGRLKLAFAATNVGGKLQFEQRAEDLPLTYKFGSAYRLGESWLFSADAGFPRNDRPFLAAGGEWRLAGGDRWRFAWRGGFNSQTVGGVAGLTGVSMGFGVGFGRAAVDYGFVPFGGLGQAHRLSLTCGF